MQQSLARRLACLLVAALLALACGCTTVLAPVEERGVPPSVDARSVRSPLAEPLAALLADVTQASISTTICQSGAICWSNFFLDTAIGCLIVDCCSKALGGKLPSLECRRTLL